MKSPIARLVPWIVAAGFAISSAWLLVEKTALRRKNEDLRTERDLAEVAYRMAQNQLAERTLLAERLITDFGRRLARHEDLRRLQVSALAGPSPGSGDTRAIAVWDPELGAGLLAIENLPAGAPEYQIWITEHANGPPQSGGAFRPDDDGAAVVAIQTARPMKKITGIAVSAAPTNGAAGADGPFVLSGRFSSRAQ